jgi:hypothetical protein
VQVPPAHPYRVQPPYQHELRLPATSRFNPGVTRERSGRTKVCRDSRYRGASPRPPAGQWALD